MKKIFLISAILFPALVLAQVLSNQAVVIPAEVVKVPFDVKVFVQQILTNGGLVLLTFLLAKIPVVGPYIKKCLDVLMANVAHK